MRVDELLEMLRTTAETIGNRFERPDDDWLTVCAWHDSQEQRGTLAPLVFSNEDEKVRALAEVSDVMRACDADVAGLVMSSWGARVTKEQVAESERRGESLPKPSQSPLRQELLLILGKERGAPIVSMWAEIQRHDDAPPTLGEWEVSEHEMSGLFADLLNTVG